MRLICPECAAQYEVDPIAIPDAGRDVHCSACDTKWFHPGIGERIKPLSLGGDKPGDALVRVVSRIINDEIPPPRPKIDQAILNILHEEAARETRARIDEGTLAADPVPVTEAVAKSGFWVGFGIVIFVAALAFAVYVAAKTHGQTIPFLTHYAVWVDDLRISLGLGLRRVFGI